MKHKFLIARDSSFRNIIRPINCLRMVGMAHFSICSLNAVGLYDGHCTCTERAQMEFYDRSKRLMDKIGFDHFCNGFGVG